MLTTRPRGTGDILPGESEKWLCLEKTAMNLAREYNFKEIRTPIFEHTELFIRGVGDTTDIVEKEMYTFKDRGQRSLTLRPEGTAPAVRAYLENNLNAGPQPVKLFYIGPMFRYDRPQSGRYRQFHQFGVEVFGSHDPAVDAEVMAMAMSYYSKLGLNGLELHVNSVGCPNCRPALKEQLQNYFKGSLNTLCANCQDRYQRNPLRILDCKSPGCQEKAAGAPTTLDCLCEECRSHFDAVRRYLEALGIDHVVDSSLVRGLDYYTHTAFEIMARDIGAQSSVGGGGRYNGLVEACGGPPTPGIGFALGLERVLLALSNQETIPPGPEGPHVFVVTADNEAGDAVVNVLYGLRKQGLSADKDYLGRSLKAQMKFAGKISARFVVILGKNEVEKGVGSLKDMENGSQEEVPLAELSMHIKRKLLIQM